MTSQNSTMRAHITYLTQAIPFERNGQEGYIMVYDRPVSPLDPLWLDKAGMEMLLAVSPYADTIKAAIDAGAKVGEDMTDAQAKHVPNNPTPGGIPAGVE